MRREKTVRKSYIIHVLEMSFTLLNRKIELIILALIGFIAEDIERSIIYIALSINTCKAKSLYTNISRL